MKLARRNVFLLGAVLILGGLELTLRSPAAGLGRGGRLLPNLVADEVTGLRLERGGERLDLERTEAGWCVVQKERFPAHQELVDELLARLGGVSRTDLVSSDESSSTVFGLGEDALRVELLAERGESRAVLWVGRPEELTQGAYVRLDGEPEVYRAATLPALETDPMRWLDTLLVDLDPTLVQTIRIQPAPGADPEREEIELVRLEDGRWRSAKHAKLLTAQLVDPLLLMGSNLYFVDLAPERATEEGATIVFELQGGGRRQIWIGNEDARGNLRVRNGFWEGPWVALLSGSTAARLELARQRIEQGLR